MGVIGVTGPFSEHVIVTVMTDQLQWQILPREAFCIMVEATIEVSFNISLFLTYTSQN